MSTACPDAIHNIASSPATQPTTTTRCGPQAKAFFEHSLKISRSVSSTMELTSNHACRFSSSETNSYSSAHVSLLFLLFLSLFHPCFAPVVMRILLVSGFHSENELHKYDDEKNTAKMKVPPPLLYASVYVCVRQCVCASLSLSTSISCPQLLNHAHSMLPSFSLTRTHTHIRYAAVRVCVGRVFLHCGWPPYTAPKETHCRHQTRHQGMYLRAGTHGHAHG